MTAVLRAYHSVQWEHLEEPTSASVSAELERLVHKEECRTTMVIGWPMLPPA